MVFELPPGYQPSADEVFMNPMQVEYFRRRLEQSRAGLRRELDAIPPPKAHDITQEGDQTDYASADANENLRFRTTNGSRDCCARRNERFQSLRMVHTATAKTPANRSI